MTFDEIAVLLQLHSLNIATEANLWMMYTAAALACAGFGITTKALSSKALSILACIGFIAFAYGQYSMIVDIIGERKEIVAQLKLVDNNHLLYAFVNNISNYGLTKCGAKLTHSVVDITIVLILLHRSFGNLFPVFKK